MFGICGINEYTLGHNLDLEESFIGFLYFNYIKIDVHVTLIAYSMQVLNSIISKLRRIQIICCLEGGHLFCRKLCYQTNKAGKVQ